VGRRSSLLHFGEQKEWRQIHGVKERNLRVIDPNIAGSLLDGFFLAVITPFTVTLILSQLTARTIAAATFAGCALPLFVGLLLEHKSWQENLYRILPWIMGFEILATAAAFWIYQFGVSSYYIYIMAVFGIVTTMIAYLIRVLKYRYYGEHYAQMERRNCMADALGYLIGSILVFAGVLVIRHIWMLLGFCVLHSICVYSFRVIPFLQRMD